MTSNDKEARRNERATRRFLRSTKKISRKQMAKAKKLVKARPELALGDALVELGYVNDEEAKRLLANPRVANLHHQYRADRTLEALLATKGLVDEETLAEARRRRDQDVTSGSLALMLEKMNVLPKEQLHAVVKEARERRNFNPEWESVHKGLRFVYVGAVFAAIGVFFSIGMISALVLFIMGLVKLRDAPLSRIRTFATTAIVVAGLGFVIITVHTIRHWDGMLSLQLMVSAELWMMAATSLVMYLLFVGVIWHIAANNFITRVGDQAVYVMILFVLYAAGNAFTLYRLGDTATLAGVDLGILWLARIVHVVALLWLAVLARQTYMSFEAKSALPEPAETPAWVR